MLDIQAFFDLLEEDEKEEDTDKQTDIETAYEDGYKKGFEDGVASVIEKHKLNQLNESW